MLLLSRRSGARGAAGTVILLVRPLITAASGSVQIPHHNIKVVVVVPAVVECMRD